MSNELSKIRELSELFQNQEVMREDFNEAMLLMQEHLHRKYVKKIEDTVLTCQKKAKKEQTSEIAFLKACKPFVDESSHEKIDGMIDVLQTMSTLNILMNGMGETSDKRPVRSVSTASVDISENKSVHEDGVYDVDSKCVVENTQTASPFGNLGGMLMMMSLLQSGK